MQIVDLLDTDFMEDDIPVKIDDIQLGILLDIPIGIENDQRDIVTQRERIVHGILPVHFQDTLPCSNPDQIRVSGLVADISLPILRVIRDRTPFGRDHFLAVPVDIPPHRCIGEGNGSVSALIETKGQIILARDNYLTGIVHKADAILFHHNDTVLAG